MQKDQALGINGNHATEGFEGLVFRGVGVRGYDGGGGGLWALGEIRTGGRSGFQFVPLTPTSATANPRISVGTETTRAVVTDAQPIRPLAEAEYPSLARGAKWGVVTVAVRITIDTEGRVVDVTPSLSHLALPSRFSREFQDAVEVALAQWRFVPSEVKHMEEAPGAEGATYLRLARREKIEARGEVVFTFSDDGAVGAGWWGK
jgi:hypothetical protein